MLLTIKVKRIISKDRIMAVEDCKIKMLCFIKNTPRKGMVGIKK